MASLFKRFKKKLPSVTAKSSAYYTRENIILNMADLLRILNGAPELKEFKTDKELTFNNIPLLEINQAILKRNFDKPAYVLSRSAHIPGHKVVFYKDSVLHFKFLIQYHFINDQFFFACNRLSSHAVLSDSNKKSIINRISKKYLGEENSSDIKPVIKVVDPNGSIIYTIDDVYFYMYYLPQNETKELLIKKYTDYTDEDIKPQGFTDTLEKYI